MAEKRVKVKWAPEHGIGATDAKDTYCCDATPAWYVVFAGDKPWEGMYFAKTDLVEI